MTVSVHVAIDMKTLVIFVIEFDKNSTEFVSFFNCNMTWDTVIVHKMLQNLTNGYKIIHNIHGFTKMYIPYMQIWDNTHVIIAGLETTYF